MVSIDLNDYLTYTLTHFTIKRLKTGLIVHTHLHTHTYLYIRPTYNHGEITQPQNDDSTTSVSDTISVS